MRITRLSSLVTLAACAALSLTITAALRGSMIVDGFLFDTGLAVRALVAEPTSDISAGDSASSSVAIIAVDAASLNSDRLRDHPRALFGPEWGALIDALSEAGAKVIAFDFIQAYSAERIQAGFDRPLLSALAQNRDKVVLGRSAETLPARPYMGAMRFAPDGVGALELIADDDGVYRRIFSLLTTDGDTKLRTISNAVLQRAGGPQMPPEVIIAPRFHPEALPSYSLAGVLACANEAPETLAEYFADKVVFVGTTLPEEDRKRSSVRFMQRNMPVAGSLVQTGSACAGAAEVERVPGPMVSGVYLHAAAVDAVLKGDLISPAAPWAPVAFALLVSLLGGVLALTFAPWTIALVGSFLVMTVWALQALLLNWNIWLQSGPALLGLLGAIVLAYIARYLTEERQRRRVQHAFGFYLAPEMVARLTRDRNALRLGGEERFVTVMFADLSGFTELSTRVSATELVERTNTYLQIIADAVGDHQGYVDKFIGDAVMAIWGAPLDDPEHARHAVAGAAQIASDIAKQGAADEAAGLASFDIKIGLATGPVIVGNVGAEYRFNYTAVGQTVNIAARLEGLPPVYGCNWVIGPNCASAVEDDWLIRELDCVAVKGRAEGLVIYEPICRAESATPEQLAITQAYARALAAYRDREFVLAMNLWSELASTKQDSPSNIMAKRARDYTVTPPPPDWDGIWVMQTK